MMLILETPEEEKAIRQGTITALELNNLITKNKFNSNIKVAVNTIIVA